MRAAEPLIAALLVLAAPIAQASSPIDDVGPDPDRVHVWSNTTETGPVDEANVSGQADADPPTLDVLIETHIEASPSSGNDTADAQVQSASPDAADAVWASGAEIDAFVDA